MKTFYLLGAFFLITQLSSAQTDHNTNENTSPGVVKEKYVLFTDNLSFKNYEEAQIAFDWLFENKPDLNVNLYIKGIKLYEVLLEKEEKEGKDPEKIEIYQDKILSLFDERIKYFGEEERIQQLKGRKMYFYYKNRKDPQKWQKMYELYNRIFELNGSNTSRSNLTFLMLSIVNQHKRKVFTEDEAFVQYEAISEKIEENINNKKKAEQERWIDLQDKIDDLLPNIFPIDCDFVREKMGDRIINNPEDIKTAKRAIKFMLKDKCTDDPLFLKAAENIFVPEPSVGLANTIAQKYQIEKDFDKAIEWKKKAIELSSDNTEKQAELSYDIALLKSIQGKVLEARNEAFQAIKFHQSIASKAYELVGNLYMGSGKDCADPNPVKARAVYLAAYDMYAKAGNRSKMKQASAQFPSIQDIHTMPDMKEGDAIQVECWIGVSTTIRRRPSE